MTKLAVPLVLMVIGLFVLLAAEGARGAFELLVAGAVLVALIVMGGVLHKEKL
ncbi:MAG: hypothetical protein M1131_07865 [Actinobacteria bacterium]|nr:hypothetical protein [Actinomycetota bacterium]MCL6095055.1 hypothetical protein [Actinomycetota bacterium]